MRIFRYHVLITVLLTGVIGCEENQTLTEDSSSPATPDSRAKLETHGCSITEVDSGAKVACSDGEVVLTHGNDGSKGASGPTGSQGPRGPKGDTGARGPVGPSVGGPLPYLVDGDGTVIDRVITAVGNNRLDGVIIWNSETQSTASYFDGKISWGSLYYFESTDCSGTAHILKLPDSTDNNVNSINHLTYSSHNDQFYKITANETSLDMNSKVTPGNGACTTEVKTGSFYKMQAVNPGIPPLLSSGWHVSFK